MAIDPDSKAPAGRSVVGKPGAGKKRITVTATFSVTFDTYVTKDQLADLESGGEDIANVVDEGDAYRLANSEGDCEMEWDLP